MGSSSVRKRRRQGALPLGVDPGLSPMTPVGQIDAAGKIARAWTRGSRRQRRAAAVFLIVAAIPAVIAVGAVLVSAMT